MFYKSFGAATAAAGAGAAAAGAGAAAGTGVASALHATSGGKAVVSHIIVRVDRFVRGKYTANLVIAS